MTRHSDQRFRYLHNDNLESLPYHKNIAPSTIESTVNWIADIYDRIHWASYRPGEDAEHWIILWVKNDNMTRKMDTTRALIFCYKRPRWTAMAIHSNSIISQLKNFKIVENQSKSEKTIVGINLGWSKQPFCCELLDLSSSWDALIQSIFLSRLTMALMMNSC